MSEPTPAACPLGPDCPGRTPPRRGVRDEVADLWRGHGLDDLRGGGTLAAAGLVLSLLTFGGVGSVLGILAGLRARRRALAVGAGTALATAAILLGTLTLLLALLGSAGRRW